MLSLYRTLSYRFLCRHWFRTGLVILSIALGVTTLVATRALKQSMTVAGQEANSPLAGLADFQVDNGEVWVRRDLSDQLRAIPGVQRAEPVIVERVLLPDLGNRSALVFGVELKKRWQQTAATDPADLARANPWELSIALTRSEAEVALAYLRNERLALVGKDLAAELGDRPRISGNGLPRTLTPIGTVEARGAAAVLNQTVIVMDLAHAAEILGRPDDHLVSRIDLFLEPGANRDEVQRSAQETVAGRAVVRPREARGAALREVMASLELTFSLSGLGALVIGLFLVYNALSVTVAERRHDVGIMRSLGATRGQVAGLFAGEAVFLGLAGTLLGIPLGVGLAWAALGPISRTLSDYLIPMEATRVVLTPATLILALVAGVITAVLAAVLPSWQAATDHPADAVRRVPTAAGLPFRLFQAGLLGVVLGLGLYLLRSSLPVRAGLFGGITLALLGCFLTLPLAAAALARLVQPLARRFGGVGVRLAADNLVRVPGRTGLVIAALAAAVTLVLQTAGVTCSNERPLMHWIDQTLTADLFVTAGAPIHAPNQNLAVSDSAGKEIEQLPGVDKVLAIRFRRPDFRHTIVQLIAFDAQAYHDVNRQRQARVPHLDQFPKLKDEGTCLISNNFAALHHVQTNDTFSVGGPDGPVQLRAVGQIDDYSWSRGTVIVDRTTYQKRFRDTRVDVFDVYLRQPHQPGGEDPEAVRRRVEAWCARQTLFVSPRAEVQRYIRDILRRLYGIAYAQQIAVAVVAAIGVLTALLISVLQRRRELGLLRAVGATRAQVLRSVVAEALLMGTIGTLMGVVIGVPYEWVSLQVIREESGYVFPLLIPWLEVAIIAASALLLATLAGLLPALRAVRLRIAEAIAYE